MATLDKRIDDLERRIQPPGRAIVIFGPDWWNDETPEAWELRKAQARANAREGDTLIVTEYTHDWRPPMIDDTGDLEELEDGQ